MTQAPGTSNPARSRAKFLSLDYTKSDCNLGQSSAVRVVVKSKFVHHEEEEKMMMMVIVIMELL